MQFAMFYIDTYKFLCFDGSLIVTGSKFSLTTFGCKCESSWDMIGSCRILI